MHTLLLLQRLIRPRMGVLIALLAIAAPAALHAQSDKEIADKIAKSGLSPDQIRSQLKASGYSANLLDGYFTGTVGGGVPSKDVLAAVGALSAADRAAQAASTKAIARPDTVTSAPTTENGIEVFGLDMFRRNTTQFDPNVAGPVDRNYRLGPTDMVAVILTGRAELSYTLDVSRDGFIVIPTVGQVFVANMTLEMATNVIVQKLRSSYANAGTSADSPTRVYVSVGRLRNNQIFVTGDAVAPGSYQISAAGTALTALYAAGGPSVNGTLRRIEVRRGGKVAATLDVYDYLLRGDASRDVRLENGDVVFVATHSKRVAISGEIRRSALYDLKPTETLGDLLTAAGGLNPTAGNTKIQVSRILPPAQRREGRDRVLIDVAMDPESNQMSTFPLQDGDRVSVFAVVARVRDQIKVEGSVWTPGTVSFHPGLRLSEAIRKAGGARPETHRSSLSISRLTADEVQRTQIRASLDSLGRPVPDIELRDGDVVRLFNEGDFRTERAVSLGGAVRKAGKFDYTVNMTLADVLTLGGGVEDGTDVMDSVTVSRLQNDMTRRVMSVPLRDRSDFSAFPLEAGDDVRVYSRSEFRPDRTVIVGGDVNKSGSIPFQAGMTLRQAILASGGLRESALLTEVEISRFPNDRKGGKTAQVMRVPIDSTYIFERGPDGKYLGPPGVPAPVNKAPEVVLQPYDHVNVLRQPDWEIPGFVTVTGEVRYPGSYTIRNRNETIADIIARAGGFTDKAYIDGVDFRREIPAAERAERQRIIDRVRKERTYMMSQERVQVAAASAARSGGADVNAAAGTEEAALNALLAAEAETSERVGINLATAMRKPSGPENLKLRPGDQLIVPAYTPTITVRGFVNSPASVLYKPGADLKYYLRAAGGVSSSGDMARAFVQQPNGQIEAVNVHRYAPDGIPTPRAGAIVVVPAANPKIETDQTNILPLIQAIAGIAGTIVAVTSILRR
jgi:polysaccharide export outer membrane protein